MILIGVKEKPCQKSVKLCITCFSLKYQNTFGTNRRKNISTSSLSNHLYRSHVNEGATSLYNNCQTCLTGRTL